MLLQLQAKAQALSIFIKVKHMMLFLVQQRCFCVRKRIRKTRVLHGSEKANDIGEQMILARRLAEYGTRFVTLHCGGWDMHSNVSNAPRQESLQLTKQ